MTKKIVNLLYLILLSIFIVLIIFFYFSEENIKRVNKSKYIYSEKLKNYVNELPLLKNDTKNSIEYISAKKKEYNLFWNLIDE